MGPTDEPLVLRRLGREAIPMVRDLWAQAGLPTRPTGRDSDEVFGRELEETRSFLLGAFEGDRLVGVVLGTDDGRKGWINRLAVVPSHLRRGVGTRLIRECERVFSEQGIRLTACLIEEGNSPSLALFRKAGYDLRRDVLYLRRPLQDSDW